MLTAIQTQTPPAPALLARDAPSQRRRAVVACVGLTLLLAAEDGLCREPAASARAAAAAARAQPQNASNRPSAVGWTVLIASLAAGAATTAYGLGISCEEADRDCSRHSSLAIWGGIGIASIGSAFALGSMQTDDAPPGTARALRWSVRTASGAEPRRSRATTLVSVAGVF
jgi:hypothetical protein